MLIESVAFDDYVIKKWWKNAMFITLKNFLHCSLKLSRGRFYSLWHNAPCHLLNIPRRKCKGFLCSFGAWNLMIARVEINRTKKYCIHLLHLDIRQAKVRAILMEEGHCSANNNLCIGGTDQ